MRARSPRAPGAVRPCATVPAVAVGGEPWNGPAATPRRWSNRSTAAVRALSRYTGRMIRERVAGLVRELPHEAQYPTQGATLLVDLERREILRGYTPLRIVQMLLGGRGANMFYLHRLLDESRNPLDPEIPLIFGSGVLTGIVPSAARGNVSSWSPESGVILDCNAGDYFPSFLRMAGLDHLVLYGRAPEWTLLHIHDGRVGFLDATPYVGLDNIDLRARIANDFEGTWERDIAMASITRAGENLV